MLLTARCSRCRAEPPQALQSALAGVEQEAAGAAAGRRRLLQRRHPRQCVRRGDQWRRPAAGRLRGAVRAGAGANLRSRAGARWSDLFEAVADALLVIIGWVLWIAPLGVFALAFTVGAAAGGAAFAGLGHYIVLISVDRDPRDAGRLSARRSSPGGSGSATFTRGDDRSAGVAISTRSSLASLPAMLAAARAMGVREQVADVTLPIAVALFRATGPAMNVAVAFYVAHWLGLSNRRSAR